MIIIMISRNWSSLWGPCEGQLIFLVKTLCRYHPVTSMAYTCTGASSSGCDKIEATESMPPRSWQVVGNLQAYMWLSWKLTSNQTYPIPQTLKGDDGEPGSLSRGKMIFIPPEDIKTGPCWRAETLFDGYLWVGANKAQGRQIMFWRGRRLLELCLSDRLPGTCAMFAT